MTLRGELLDRTFVLVEHDVGPQSHFAALVGIVRQQLEQVEEHHGVVVTAIGIGCAGPIERQCATVSPVNIPAWRAFPLRQHLSEMFELPVYGDLDAKALGAGRRLARRGSGPLDVLRARRCRRASAAESSSMANCSTARPGTPATSATSSSSPTAVAASAGLVGVSRPRRPARRSRRSPAARRRSPPTRSCVAPVASSDARRRRSATCSTSISSSWAAVWRSGSRRRSSTPRRRSSTVTR